MENVTIVTGLPRSGTSLMMQIMEQTSLSVLSDGLREKDINNPEGYYELEAVKGIVKDNSFLKDAQDKVVKIVTPLPLFLDKTLNYRVLFMRRDLEEILRSQEKMLGKDQSSEREKFKTIYELHLKKTYTFFASNKIPYLDVWYKELISNTEVELKKIIDFLELPEKWEDLANAVHPELYRNKLDQKL
jgi:hypothetical protein